jgi:uncharacterized protein YjbJ (UPF0337 family)
MFGDRAVLPAPVRFYQRLLADDPAGAEEIAEAALRADGMRAMLETLVLPALDSVRADRREGVLDAGSALRIARALTAMLRELADDDPAAADAPPILVRPVAGALDEAAAEALAALLRAEGHAARTSLAAPPGALVVLAMQDRAGGARLRRAAASARADGAAVIVVALAEPAPELPDGIVAAPGIAAMLSETTRLLHRAAPRNPAPPPRVLLDETGAAGSSSKARTSIMSSTTDKVKGVANEIAGKVKQGVGRTFDKPELEAEGIVQERRGEAQQAKGEAKEQIKKVIDKA